MLPVLGTRGRAETASGRHQGDIVELDAAIVHRGPPHVSQFNEAVRELQSRHPKGVGKEFVSFDRAR